MTTRTVILSAIARDLGWATGMITSGTDTSAVLGNHIGAFGDDSALAGHTLIMPGAVTSADQERTVEHWDDSEGAAYWVRGRTDVTYTGETYFLVPPGDYTRQDIYTAINDSLGHTRTSVQTVLPTIDNERIYRLNGLSWLRSSDDVDGVFKRSSPNLITNSQFDVWGDGPNLAPTGWVLSGAGATAARADDDIPRGGYGVALTRAGTNYTLTQTCSLLNGQLRGQTVSASAFVRAASAFVVVRIGISDGITTTYSSYNIAGDANRFAEMTVSHPIDASAPTLQFIVSGETGDVTSTISNFVAVEGDSVPSPLTETGDGAYRMVPLQNPRLRQLGGTPTLELLSALSRRNQIVVTSGQPYPDLSTDADETLCPLDVIVPGAVYELTSRMRKGQDRTRIEVLMQRRRADYIALSRQLRDYPVIVSRGPVQVIGA